MDESHSLEPAEIVAGRFQLRPPSPRDAEDYLAIVSDPATRLWNPARSVRDLETSRAFCERMADWDGGRVAEFFVYDATEGKLLGTTALHQIDWGQMTAEIGYKTAPWAREQGVATAAVRSVAGWAFGALGIGRIEVRHAVGNEASCRVAAKCGFVLEGTLRESHRYGDGLMHDEHVHGRLASDPAVS